MAIPDQKQDQMRERREEQQLFQRFQNVATSKLEKLSKTTSRANGSNDIGQQSSSKLEFGEEEQKIISRMAGMGLKEGILASIASFVILRRGPKYIGRWVQRRHNNNTMQQQQSSSSYKLSDPNKLNNKSNTSNNPFERAQQTNNNNNHFPRPRGLVSRSIWFVFDSFLSLLVGANVSMLYTDKSRIRQQIAELPLVPGRSLAADALCDEMVQELHKIQQEKNPAYQRLKNSKNSSHSNPAASFFLEGIEAFCQNCQRRRYAETTIREQTGLEKTAPVHIPAPGVPRDGPLLSMDSDEGMQEPFFDPFDPTTTRWANDFPSDDFGSESGRQ